MQLSKQTVLKRADRLKIVIKSTTYIELKFNQLKYPGCRYTLAVLDTFSTAKTFARGVDELKQRALGTQSFLDLVQHIINLFEIGILEEPGRQQPVISAHSARYDGAQVHIRMLNDQARTAAYQRGIRETVKSDDIVVDVGTGTGILAATAAMAGAKHVYAIEPSNMGRYAQQLFDRNNLSERITMIEGQSTGIELPQKATLMVSELIGNDPLGEQILPTTMDAVKRLLEPDARMIPSSLTLYGLPVTVPSEELAKVLFTEKTAVQWRDWYGIDFSHQVEATDRQDNSMLVNTQNTRKWLKLSDPVLLAEIDLKTWHGGDVESTGMVEVTNSGLLSGIIVYFETKLGKTTTLSIHPNEASLGNHWASKVWIPGTPLSLKAGSTIKLHYRYDTNLGSVFQVQ